MLQKYLGQNAAPATSAGSVRMLQAHLGTLLRWALTGAVVIAERFADGEADKEDLRVAGAFISTDVIRRP